MRLIILALCCLTSLAAPLRAEQVTVFAAASLKTVLDALQPEFESNSGAKLSLVYAGSSTLARQIEQGAPADIFISANTDWMAYLEGKGAIQPETRLDLLGNALVLVSHEAGGNLPLPDFAQTDGRVAIGLVSAVPAGIYAHEALQHLGLWHTVAPRAVQTDNVRAALALVARGEAPFGIIYRSDALAEPKVHLRATFPEASHSPILYPAAMTARAKPAAQAFMAFLQSAQAAEAFAAHGFTPLGARP